jgi:diacylglycerol O-acyltransferase / wax synthase
VAFVPVSTRGGDSEIGTRGAPPLGTRVSGMLISLATDVEDPTERLQVIAAGTRVAKEQEKLTGSRLIEDLAQMAAPAVASRVARWTAGLRIFDRLPPLFTLTVSSVPGPEFSLFCAGSQVAEIRPIGPVAEGAGLNITAMSYGGILYFGLLGCRRLVPEVQDLAILLDEAIGELVGLALELRGAVG